MYNNNIIGVIPTGTEVDIIGEMTRVSGRNWYPVRYLTYQGYVVDEYINITKSYLGEQLVIPFGEYVDITKMTVDRLWCYAPDFESWIKAEDISFNQAGKLYNGLKIDVIDLDGIDFSNVSSLEDMGIDI